MIETLGETIKSAITALGTVLSAALLGKAIKGLIPPILGTPGTNKTPGKGGFLVD